MRYFSESAVTIFYIPNTYNFLSIHNHGNASNKLFSFPLTANDYFFPASAAFIDPLEIISCNRHHYDTISSSTSLYLFEAILFYIKLTQHCMTLRFVHGFEMSWHQHLHVDNYNVHYRHSKCF